MYVYVYDMSRKPQRKQPRKAINFKQKSCWSNGREGYSMGYHN